MFPVRIRGPVSQDNSMEIRYSKLFRVIFQGKLELDKWGVEALANNIGRIKPVTDKEAKDAIQTLIDAFEWRVSKRYIKPTIVLGKYSNLGYLVLFPMAAWTRNKSDLDRYTVGNIEMDPDIEGRTNMVDLVNGEIRQSDPVHMRKQ